MTAITLQHLQAVRETYKQAEQRAIALGAAETTPEQKTRYREEELKARGMKEAVEGLIFDLTGEFPTD